MITGCASGWPSTAIERFAWCDVRPTSCLACVFMLVREVKPGYFDRPPRPRVSPLSERLAEFAKRR
jgi:hypothetical protein